MFIKFVFRDRTTRSNMTTCELDRGNMLTWSEDLSFGRLRVKICLYRARPDSSTSNSKGGSFGHIETDDGLKSIEMTTRTISGKRSGFCGNTTPSIKNSSHIKMVTQDSMEVLQWRRRRMRESNQIQRTMSPHALSSLRMEYPKWIQRLSWQKFRPRIIPSRVVQ